MIWLGGEIALHLVVERTSLANPKHGLQWELPPHRLLAEGYRSGWKDLDQTTREGGAKIN